MTSKIPEAALAYDSDAAITAEVLSRYALTPDPRLREIMQSLIGHLHGFVRDVNLSWEEWEYAMSYLAKAGAWCKGPRNEFIGLSDSIGLTMLVIALSQRKPPGATMATLVGPFFVPDAPTYGNGADIANGAKGTPLFVSGRVLDLQGAAIANASIDVWHSDSDGFYDVQGDVEKTGLWGRGRLTSAADGSYSFWTVMPTAYPAPTDGALGDLFMNTTRRYYRPAHLHFSVNAPDCVPLITQAFVRGSAHLDEDVGFGVRPRLIFDYPRHEGGTAPDGRRMDTPYHTLEFDIVLVTT